MTHGPVEEEVVVKLNALGRLLKDETPEGWGFTLLMFRIGEGEGHRMNYLSSANRDDMLKALKELVVNMEQDRMVNPNKR
jgi:hypothetical protein